MISMHHQTVVEESLHDLVKSFKHKLVGKSRHQRDRILKNQKNLIDNIQNNRPYDSKSVENLTKDQVEQITFGDLIRIRDPNMAEKRRD